MGGRKLLIIEELDPFLEEQIKAMGIDAVGKKNFPPWGELLHHTLMAIESKEGILLEEKLEGDHALFIEVLPERSPVLCLGCPHRTSFYLLNKMKLPVAGDIGCYNLGTFPPFNGQHTMGATNGDSNSTQYASQL